MLVTFTIISILIIAGLILFGISFNKTQRILLESVKSIIEANKDIINRQYDQAKEISGIIQSHQKGMRLFSKVKRHLLDSLASIENLTLNLCESQRHIISTFNDFSDNVGANFQEIFCDLYESQCNECPFFNQCTEVDNSSRYMHLEGDQNPPDKGIFEQNCGISSITLDPRDKDFGNKMKQALMGSGVPENIAGECVERFSKQLKRLGINTEEIGISWILRNENGKTIPPQQNNSTKSPSNPDEEVLINPNAKIVKTLENLFNLSE